LSKSWQESELIYKNPLIKEVEMRGRKEALWAVVISAALLTAGLILSCGDDDNGAAVDCQDACAKLAECDDFIPSDYFGYTVRECEVACEDELAGAGGEDFAEMFECFTDTGCEDILDDCLCQAYCEKLDECDILLDWDTVEECVTDCGEDNIYPGEILCTIGFSSCNLIWEYCYGW
jgi:hypothetical protein